MPIQEIAHDLNEHFPSEKEILSAMIWLHPGNPYFFPTAMVVFH